MVALVKPSEDPVRARRAVIGRRVGWASRAGYGALGIAVIAFALAVATDFPSLLVTLTIAGLVAACLVLPVTIIMGYGIRAAERADREQRYG
jgi:hypothetical protein